MGSNSVFTRKTSVCLREAIYMFSTVVDFYRNVGKTIRISEVYNRKENIQKSKVDQINVLTFERQSNFEGGFLSLIFLCIFSSRHILVYLSVNIVSIFLKCSIFIDRIRSSKNAPIPPLLSFGCYTKVIKIG